MKRLKEIFTHPKKTFEEKLQSFILKNKNMIVAFHPNADNGFARFGELDKVVSVINPATGYAETMLKVKDCVTDQYIHLSPDELFFNSKSLRELVE